MAPASDRSRLVPVDELRLHGLRRSLRMPSKAADRLIADAGRSGSDNLQRTIEQLADLELASRGGGSGGAGEDTVALLAIQRVAA